MNELDRLSDENEKLKELLQQSCDCECFGKCGYYETPTFSDQSRRCDGDDCPMLRAKLEGVE